MNHTLQKLTAAALFTAALAGGAAQTAFASGLLLYANKPFVGLSSEMMYGTQDDKKGQIDLEDGIISGQADGYSSWRQDETGWKLQYADKTYAGSCWEQIDGAWYYFREDGYAADGWFFDPSYNGWFYIDINTGMKTGWQLLDGAWYYFYTGADQVLGMMAANTQIGGCVIGEDGTWDGIYR